VRGDTTAEVLAKLRPAFGKDGTITAGTSSPISDGACAVVVMSKAKAEELGLTWLAEIGAHGNVAGPDNSLHSQPANAIAQALKKEGLAPPTSTSSRSTRRSRRSASSPQRSWESARSRQRQRWRDRARPPDRHVRRTAGAHARARAAPPGGGVGAAALCGGGGQGDALILRVPRT
jgi:acetyl-CoA C-acetyltransferase